MALIHLPEFKGVIVLKLFNCIQWGGGGHCKVGVNLERSESFCSQHLAKMSLS